MLIQKSVFEILIITYLTLMAVISTLPHSLPDAGKTDSIGFSSQRALGEEVLPKILGPITRFNANGKSVPDKTAPKETAYRQISWTRKQWIGGGATQEVTDTREIEYKRYKRILTPPPSIELKIVENLQGEKLIISPKLSLTANNKELVAHCINLFLELFGLCETVDDQLNTIVKSKSIKLTGASCLRVNSLGVLSAQNPFSY
ncbi:Uncharacterised protein [Escherichia coli]|nr:Uncharacterised protein [Escherichia coli]